MIEKKLLEVASEVDKNNYSDNKSSILKVLSSISGSGRGRSILFCFGGGVSHIFDVRSTGSAVAALIPSYSGQKMTDVMVSSSDQNFETGKVMVSVSCLVLLAITFESIARVSGLLAPALRGDWMKPSSLVSIGTSLTTATLITSEMYGGLKEARKEGSTDLLKRLMEATSGQTALNTGPKMRFSYLQKEPGMVLASAMISAVILYSGKNAIRDRPGTRASTQLKASTSVVRSLFKSLNLEQRFNGLSACYPEMSLLGISSGQSVTPVGLLTIRWKRLAESYSKSQ